MHLPMSFRNTDWRHSVSSAPTCYDCTSPDVVVMPLRQCYSVCSLTYSMCTATACPYTLAAARMRCTSYASVSTRARSVYYVCEPRRCVWSCAVDATVQGGRGEPAGCRAVSCCWWGSQSFLLVVGDAPLLGYRGQPGTGEM